MNRKHYKDAAEAFLESPMTMALVSPDPDGPASLSQSPQVALLRSGNLRIVLLGVNRKRKIPPKQEMKKGPVGEEKSMEVLETISGD